MNGEVTLVVDGSMKGVFYSTVLIRREFSPRVTLGQIFAHSMVVESGPIEDGAKRWKSRQRCLNTFTFFLDQCNDEETNLLKSLLGYVKFI